MSWVLTKINLKDEIFWGNYFLKLSTNKHDWFPASFASTTNTSDKEDKCTLKQGVKWLYTFIFFLTLSLASLGRVDTPRKISHAWVIYLHEQDTQPLIQYAAQSPRLNWSLLISKGRLWKSITYRIRILPTFSHFWQQGSKLFITIYSANRVYENKSISSGLFS